jgi:hypothetical protein
MRNRVAVLLPAPPALLAMAALLALLALPALLAMAALPAAMTMNSGENTHLQTHSRPPMLSV